MQELQLKNSIRDPGVENLKQNQESFSNITKLESHAYKLTNMKQQRAMRSILLQTMQKY